MGSHSLLFRCCDKVKRPDNAPFRSNKMTALGTDPRIVEIHGANADSAGEVVDMKIRDGAACRILLIEDDAPVRERLAEIISRWPGGQLVAACGKLVDAMVVIRDEVVDLLITDLNLPDG